MELRLVRSQLRAGIRLWSERKVSVPDTISCGRLCKAIQSRCDFLKFQYELKLRRENDLRLKKILSDLEVLQNEKKKTANQLDVVTKQLSDSLISVETKNNLIRDVATKLVDMEKQIMKKNEEIISLVSKISRLTKEAENNINKLEAAEAKIVEITAGSKSNNKIIKDLQEELNLLKEKQKHESDRKNQTKEHQVVQNNADGNNDNIITTTDNPQVQNELPSNKRHKKNDDALMDPLKFDHNYGTWVEVSEFSKDKKIDVQHCENLYSSAIVKGLINSKVEVLNDDDEYPDFVNIINLLGNFMRYGPGKSNYFFNFKVYLIKFFYKYFY